MQDMEKHVSRLDCALCACCHAVVTVVRETCKTSRESRADDVCRLFMIERMEAITLDSIPCAGFWTLIDCDVIRTLCVLNVSSLINLLQRYDFCCSRLDQRCGRIKGSERDALVTIEIPESRVEFDSRHEVERSPEKMVEDERWGAWLFSFLHLDINAGEWWHFWATTTRGSSIWLRRRDRSLLPKRLVPWGNEAQQPIQQWGE